MLATSWAALTLALASPGIEGVADSLLTASGAPGAAVAFMESGEVRIAAAGTRINGQDAPITPDDLWHMGSNTKAMTATLAARLVEQGYIGWDTTIAAAFEGLDIDIHPDLAGADLTSLLTHRSGIMANAGVVTALRLAGTDSGRDVVADRLIYARAVLGDPGGAPGDFLYSNAGYVIAAMMLEQVTATPYEVLMAREVFEPLGMESAGWGPPGVAGEADQPRGHRPGMLRLIVAEPGVGADNPPAMNPAARAHMTMADLLVFLDLHRRGAAGEETGYLTAESFERLHTPVGDYAFGWGVRPDGTLAHSGSNTMWLVTMRVDTRRAIVAAAGVNDGRLDRVAAPVSAALDAVMDINN